MLRGLFVGIDKYSAPVNRLSCARADAQALGSLFEDTLEGDVNMLLDQDATKANITTQLQALSACEEDDFVVISFAGHGTEDHRLVPVDVDPNDPAASCISLDELAQLLDAIPAKQLFVFLDCCFSGGFGGARVFAPTARRSMIEDRSSLVALANGDGRIVVTASGAGEPSLETVAAGHGIFTYHLIQGLQGPESIVTAGRIGVMNLFNYVMEHVVEEARTLQEVQTPTFYGSVAGSPTLAVLAPGVKYAGYFPERVRTPATTDWQSLVSYGFSETIIAAWSQTMNGLNELQIKAINEYGVLDEKSLLVVAPTGAGKTMIGELAALNAVGKGSRAVILLPLKALVSDKYEYFTRVYGEDVTIVQATGDNGDQVGALISGQYDIALLTYEKFMNIALGYPHVMRGVSVVVVDEVQNIADPNRGPSLEFVLTLLRSGHARGRAAQVVALSAVIGDTNGFERWLGGELLRTHERPVPLRESVVNQSGTILTLEPDGTETQTTHYIDPEIVGGSQSSKPWIIPLVRRLVGEGKKVIVFRAIKAETVGTARYLANSLGLPAATETQSRLPTGDRSSASEALRQVVEGGVGFHNSDLDRDERIVLEQTFREADSGLRVLVATTTLAMGVNTPAEAVIIAGLIHPANNPYSVAEYKNMAGRAGRMGHTDAGESYVIATGAISPNSAWSQYVKGRPENVISHFLSANTDAKTLMLRCLVALGASVQENELVELLENSFALWQRTQAGYGGWDVNDLRRDIQALVSASLIDLEPNGNLTLTALGRYAGESGIEVESVTRVSSALRFTSQSLSPGDVITLSQVTCELNDMYIPANARSTQEQRRWPFVLSNHGVDRTVINQLHVGGTNAFMATKRAAACLLYITSTPMSDIEGELMQHHRDNSAAGPIRSVATRTRDVIDAVSRIAEYHGKTFSHPTETEDLSVQLEYGIPHELVALARLAGNLMSRGQYLSLLQVGITEPASIVSADVDRLNELLGVDLTLRLIALCRKYGGEPE